MIVTHLNSRSESVLTHCSAMMKWLCLLSLVLVATVAKCQRSFRVDYQNNQFLIDGQPFRYVSGSMHYVRVHHQLWLDRMTKMRAAGVNVLQTYVEWNSHEPERGAYDFTGNNDLVEYVKTAQKAGLLVILRPGPYIDAERDGGGLPYWLKIVNPNMQLRSSDPSYIAEIDRWFSVLFPKIVPLLYVNGGPIIMVQVENEYGSFGCDFEYTSYLRDTFRSHLGNDVVLFTTDGDGDGFLQCGKIDNVFATVDFGTGGNPKSAFEIQRRHQQFGPNVDSEFYPGWLDHWENPHSVVDTKSVANSLNKILAVNASVNIYMFHGGTSFGFGAGSNIDGNVFEPCPTSYDYEAPLNEAGDPIDKYYAVRQVISKYLPLPPIPVPSPAPKMQLAPVALSPVASLFDQRFDTVLGQAIFSKTPLTFEQLKLRHGFVLYSTNISVVPSDPSLLTVNGLADRAQVFVDGRYQSTLSRTRNIYSMPVNVKKGSSLVILVENQGRVCYGSSLGEFKGITSNVTLGPTTLFGWNHQKLFYSWNQAVGHFEKMARTMSMKKSLSYNYLPTIYSGQFVLPEDPNLPLDTFLRLDGWSKGLAFLNGFNLGRYWPVVGPQVTLYAPKTLFKAYPQVNQLTVFELESAPCAPGPCQAQFVQTHVLNGTVPFSKKRTITFRKGKPYAHRHIL